MSEQDELLLTPDQISMCFRGHGLHASMAVKEGIIRDILAKVKQHYEQKLQRMALNYDIIIEETKKQKRLDRPMKLKCLDCGWIGEEEEAISGYRGVPYSGGDVEPYRQCPKCNSEDLDELVRVGEEVQLNT